MEKKLRNLEMSRKRDHKIDITDVAIMKVPRICYPEISEKHYDILQELSRRVLIASQKRNHGNEVAITYSLESPELMKRGQPYAAIAYGDEHSVDPLSNTESNHLVVSSTECVIVLIHNHPSLSKISLQDVQFLLRYYSVKMIIAVTNSGSIFYIVKTQKYDRRSAVMLYNEASALYNEANTLKGYQEASEYFLHNCSQAGLVYGNH